jgi:ABC-type molybdenum transport system ATPase subunit/photorepair protein PhrA
LATFEQEFKRINLIYGRNEGGKSFLVEFIIQCLFKNKSKWGYLRATSGSGKVILEGLEDRETAFTLSSSKKLESFMEQYMKGLPPFIMKWLIIKVEKPIWWHRRRY